jgi:hypothetical protein
MTERDNLTDPKQSEKYAKTMKDSHEELENLRNDLQNLMVRFGLRALRLYQTGTSTPLQPSQMSYLIKYELTNVFQDLQSQSNIDAIINATKAQWEKASKQK